MKGLRPVVLLLTGRCAVEVVMFQYEKSEALLSANRRLQDTLIEIDRTEGDNYHMSPNDEGFTVPHEYYLWLENSREWLEARILLLEETPVSEPDVFQCSMGG